MRGFGLGCRSPIVLIAADETKAGPSRAVGSEEKMAERLSLLRNIRRDVQPEEEDSGGGPAEEFPHTGPPEVLEFCEKVEAIAFEM